MITKASPLLSMIMITDSIVIFLDGFPYSIGGLSQSANGLSQSARTWSQLIWSLYFFVFLYFLKCLLFVSKNSFTIRISVKELLILRSYVDFLNYPFKSKLFFFKLTFFLGLGQGLALICLFVVWQLPCKVVDWGISKSACQDPLWCFHVGCLPLSHLHQCHQHLQTCPCIQGELNNMVINSILNSQCHQIFDP